MSGKDANEESSDEDRVHDLALHSTGYSRHSVRGKSFGCVWRTMNTRSSCGPCRSSGG
jgi:hypothetical protein